MFLLALLTSVAFWPGLMDPAMAPRWALLAVGAPILLLRMEHITGPLRGFGAAALLVIAATITWAPDALTGLDDLCHLLILAAVFLVGANSESLTPAWKGLAVGMIVNAAIGAAQYLGWEGIDQVAAPAATFMNKNGFAEAGMVVLVAMLCEGEWLLAVAPLLAVTLGRSTAVFGALGVAFAAWLWQRNRRAAIALLVVIGAGFLLTIFNNLRLQFWLEAVRGMTVLGHGLGSFATDFVFAEYAHNEPIQAAYELGIFALLPAAIVVHLLTEQPHETDLLVFISICVVGLLAFPLHAPTTGFAAALSAGRLARVRHRIRWPFVVGALLDQGHREPQARDPGSDDLHRGHGRGDLPAGSAPANGQAHGARVFPLTRALTTDPAAPPRQAAVTRTN